MVDDLIDILYPMSKTHIPYRDSYLCIVHVRSPISISRINVGSYLVALHGWCRLTPGRPRLVSVSCDDQIRRTACKFCLLFQLEPLHHGAVCRFYDLVPDRPTVEGKWIWTV